MCRVLQVQLLALISLVGVSMAQDSAPSEPAPPGHVQATAMLKPEERAAQVVAALKIKDSETAHRIEGLIADHYRRLHGIYSARDARIAEAAGRPGDATVAEAWRNVARKDANLKLFPLHRQFVARLEAELTPEQVDQVKNAMTGNRLPAKLDIYNAVLPNLTPAQHAEVLAKLLEAREYAIDAASPAEIDELFARCRAQINRQLSAAGYDTSGVEAKLGQAGSNAKPSP